MNIDNLTFGEIKQLQSLFTNKNSSNNNDDAATHFVVDKCYLIRTVTFTQIGRLSSFNKQEILLENACWVADTGRFSEALRKGIEVLEEVEMVPNEGKIIVGRGSIVDVYDWIHDLPTETK